MQPGGRARESESRTGSCVATQDARSSAPRAFGEDSLVSELIDWLGGLAQRIEGEWSDESCAGKFAAGIVEGARGGASSEVEPLEGALMLSVHWDADPTGAIAMFESQEE